MDRFQFSSLAVVFCIVLGKVCEGDYVAQTVNDEVGEGNYTYYTLSHPGNLVLQMTTLYGDADLYVSSDVEQPTYQLEEHTMSSFTCGEDRVEISKFMQRPINIAVYGHPRYPASKYSLDVIVVDVDEYDPFTVDEKVESSGDPKENEPAGEESTIKVVWPIVRRILEILIDVIL